MVSEVLRKVVSGGRNEEFEWRKGVDKLKTGAFTKVGD